MSLKYIYFYIYHRKKVIGSSEYTNQYTIIETQNNPSKRITSTTTEDQDLKLYKELKYVKSFISK